MHYLLRIALICGIVYLVNGLAKASEQPHGERCEKGERCADDRLADSFCSAFSNVQLAFLGDAWSSSNAAESIAARELGWQVISETQQVDSLLRVRTAQALIDSYLEAGFNDEALRLFRSLSSGDRTLLTSGAILEGECEKGDVSLFLEASPQLTAAGLAMACADIGDDACVQSMLAAAAQPVDPGPPDTYAGDDVGRSRYAAQCTRSLLAGDIARNPFAWLFGTPPAEVGCSYMLRARSYQRRVAQQYRDAALPKDWLPGIPAQWQASLSKRDQRMAARLLKKLPAVRTRIAELNKLVAHIETDDGPWLIDTFAAEDRWFGDQEEGNASDQDRALAARISTQLQADRFNPYTQSPIDAQLSLETDQTGTCATSALRCTETDDASWALMLSQDYDPSGELPAAGFWLQRTAKPEGAVTRYYLGLKEHLPFELAEQQGPMIADGQLSLSVRVAELKSESISFPPVTLEFQRSRAVLQLRASLEAIMQDQDQDGLTDLAEQQLLLDPLSADTDGDSIPDADDSFPNVAFNNGRGKRSMALASALSLIQEGEDQAISVLVPESEQFVKRHRSSEQTLFLIVDPEDVSALSSQKRVIVIPRSLDPGVFEPHGAFATLMPMTISVEFDPDGIHAVVHFNDRWSGGAFALEWQQDHWVVGVLSSWVS
ncbi:hypothetical protein C7S18_19880 [Ahniella affigens]|uniref:Uncharacterized protein n=1 Tax=Ahniella affigens TaxID=2021234 RepID=A0A2P1PWR3_9GAMM|nr:hypothetical protein [Ahniella affigens]AVP99287.1 hypothetical protein C7S18_19880 [Ahniella affigens]